MSLFGAIQQLIKYIRPNEKLDHQVWYLLTSSVIDRGQVWYWCRSASIYGIGLKYWITVRY